MRERGKIEPGFSFEQLSRWLSVPGQEIEKGDQILASERRMIVLLSEYNDLKEKIWGPDEKVSSFR